MWWSEGTRRGERGNLYKSLWYFIHTHLGAIEAVVDCGK